MRVKTIAIPAAALVLCCCIPAGAAQKKVRMKLGQRVSIEMRREAPTFASVKPPRLMDRGQLLLVGKGMWAEQHKFTFRQLSDYGALTMEAPLAAFLAAHPDAFPGAEGSGFSRYMVEGLLFLDRQDGLAAIHLRDKTKGARKHLLLWWDLKKETIRGSVLLAAEEADTKLVTVVPVHYDPELHTFYCRVDHWREGGEHGRWEVRLEALSPGSRRTVATFVPARYLSKKVFLDLPRQRVLFVEYAELARKEPPPKGHLIQFDSGARREISIPMTTYGAAFGPAGKTLYLYSNQLRSLQALDLDSGRVRKQVKVGGGGHDLAWPLPGKLMLMRHAASLVIDPQTLRRVQVLPHKDFIEGHLWIPGSYFAPGRAIIRNGDELLLMELELEDVPARKAGPRKKKTSK